MSKNDFMNKGVAIGRMTQTQKERLEEWHQKEMDARLDELYDTNPAFRASMDAMDRADELDINGLEYGLAGNIAAWEAEGFTEAEWYDGLSTNKVMQLNFNIDKIPPDDISLRLASAVSLIKAAGLWPWPSQI